ncbi:hypothetical protein VKT23_015915 [Stygiomarasmius scandens]|uniref:Zinc finger PHD-type domain-containing protein n=1 Tax=Marasmiellus scandens TaxID=2682957 RepID=A0ABR1IXW0_9AGAR
MPPKKSSNTMEKKMTARKSTGASAPTRCLAPLPTCNTDILEEQNEQLPINTRKRKKTAELTCVTYEADFARVKEDTTWCTGCQDDPETRKANCTKCGFDVCFGGVGSNACIEVADTELAWSSFFCPGCAMRGKEKQEYYGFYDASGQPLMGAVQTVRQRGLQFFRGSLSPVVAIVQLKLKGMPSDLEIPFETCKLFLDGYSSGGVSSQDVISHGLQAPSIGGLRAGYPRPMVTSSISFDLGTSAGHKQYESDLKMLLLSCDRMGVSHIMTYIVTHSDPGSGNLHFTTDDGGGAAPLEEVMEGLFPPMASNWLALKSSHLFLLVCGNKVLLETGYTYLSEKTENQMFNNIFLFPIAGLQPRHIANFSVKFGECLLYRGLSVDESVKRALNDQPVLGQHARVLHLSSLSTRQFRAERWAWCHEDFRPYGVEPPILCLKCRGLNTFSKCWRKAESLCIIFECTRKLPVNSLDQTCSYQQKCQNQVIIQVTAEEMSLPKGPKSGFGKWGKHKFIWNKQLIQRF